MRILLVAATQQEIGLLISNFGFSISDFVENESNQSTIQLTTHNLQLTVLITGVGMVATAFGLGKHLATNNYDLAINLGIAGSFDRDIALGEVVEITEDSLAELGAEDGEAFLPIETLGFGESIFRASKSLSAYGNFNLRQVTAITVNTVHGHEPSIKHLTDRVQPQLESMEGAAFFYACKQAGVPCLQIRAVSNYVEKRNREAWQIGLAIKNLNSFALDLLKALEML
jgi:futalosine hydrolase